MSSRPRRGAASHAPPCSMVARSRSAALRSFQLLLEKARSHGTLSRLPATYSVEQGRESVVLPPAHPHSFDREHPDEIGKPIRLGAREVIRNIDQRHYISGANRKRGAVRSRRFFREVFG